jgi:hypothetical protein
MKNSKKEQEIERKSMEKEKINTDERKEGDR